METNNAYTLRVWAEGQLLKELSGLDEGEAIRQWNRWDNRRGYGPELLRDGVHLTVAQVERLAGPKPRAAMPRLIPCRKKARRKERSWENEKCHRANE